MALELCQVDNYPGNGRAERRRVPGWDNGGVNVKQQARARAAAVAQCPLQPGQPCTLCHPEAKTGPQDCPTVALVMDDPQLRAEASRLRRLHHFRRSQV
jgi:hypothetical protein